MKPGSKTLCVNVPRVLNQISIVRWAFAESTGRHYRLPVNELVFSANVRHLAEQLGLLVFFVHNSRGSPAGWPDFCIVGPGGICFRELKVPGGKVSRAQLHWIRCLREAGQDVAIWTPVDLASGKIRAELDDIARPWDQRAAA